MKNISAVEIVIFSAEYRILHDKQIMIIIYFKFTQIKLSFTKFFDNIFFIQSCDLYALTLRENGFNSLDSQPRCVFLKRSGIPIHKNFIENFIFDYWETHCNEAGTVLTYRTIFLERERDCRRKERVRQREGVRICRKLSIQLHFLGINIPKTTRNKWKDIYYTESTTQKSNWLQYGSRYGRETVQVVHLTTILVRTGLFSLSGLLVVCQEEYDIDRVVVTDRHSALWGLVTWEGNRRFVPRNIDNWAIRYIKEVFRKRVHNSIKRKSHTKQLHFLL